MKLTKENIQNVIIGMIIILFIAFVSITIKNSPLIFCKFLFWMESCEDNYGKSCETN